MTKMIRIIEYHMEVAMHPARVSLPPLEVPKNVRKGVISRKDMFWLGFRMSLEPLAFAICSTVLCIFATIEYVFGPFAFFRFSAIEYVVVFVALCLFYAVVTIANINYHNRDIPVEGIVLFHGYDQDFFYGSNALHQSIERWEHYSRWKQNKRFFLLKRGVWFLIPKAMWNEDELNELRGIMKEKVGKKYPAE